MHLYEISLAILETTQTKILSELWLWLQLVDSNKKIILLQRL